MKTELILPWAIGDKVWYTEYFRYSYEVECLSCKMTGEVVLASGRTMKCGECQGRKTHVRHRPLKIRPRSGIITGFDIHNKGGKSETWWYVSTYNNFKKDKDLFATFYESRKKAQAENKKYGWPKADDKEDWLDYVPGQSKMFWGHRVGKCKKW